MASIWVSGGKLFALPERQIGSSIIVTRKEIPSSWVFFRFLYTHGPGSSDHLLGLAARLNIHVQKIIIVGNYAQHRGILVRKYEAKHLREIYFQELGVSPPGRRREIHPHRRRVLKRRYRIRPPEPTAQLETKGVWQDSFLDSSQKSNLSEQLGHQFWQEAFWSLTNAEMMILLHQCGETLQTIGSHFNLSRARVGQLLTKNYGPQYSKKPKLHAVRGSFLAGIETSLRRRKERHGLERVSEYLTGLLLTRDLTFKGRYYMEIGPDGEIIVERCDRSNASAWFGGYGDDSDEHQGRY